MSSASEVSDFHAASSFCGLMTCLPVKKPITAIAAASSIRTVPSSIGKPKRLPTYATSATNATALVVQFFACAEAMNRWILPMSVGAAAIHWNTDGIRNVGDDVSEGIIVSF